MPIFAWIASLFGPATKILENLHTSDSTKMELENALAKIKADVESKMIELETEKIKLQEVEANSSNLLTSAWRPICSMAIVGIIIAASLGYAHPDQKFYDLAQWFLVGFGVSRSMFDKGGIESAVKVISKAVKK